MWLVNFFTSSVAGDIIFKLFIAFLLSIIIGIERELFHKPAGVKTHLLICMSSTLIMSLSLYMYNLYGASMDPARLPAQIIAGIGFVGASTIIREGFNVRGITTAASLLAITCIGLAVGAGFYEGAIFTTLFIFLILSLIAPIQGFFGKGKGANIFTVTSSRSQGVISDVQNLFEQNNVTVLNIEQQVSTSNSNDSITRFLVKINDTKLKEKLLTDVCNLPNIKEVHISRDSHGRDVE